MSDVPDTNDPKVAMLGIAWAMVGQIYAAHFKENSHSETVKRVTNEVLKVYAALATVTAHLINSLPMFGQTERVRLAPFGRAWRLFPEL